MELKLEQFLFESRELNTVPDLFSMCSDVFGHYGFDQLAYVIASDHKQFASDTELGLVSHNMVNDWIEHYRESDYLEADKTTQLLRANPGIYSWNEIALRGDLSPLQKKILNEANDAKMHHGNSISIYGPGGIKSFMIAYSSELSNTPNKHKLDIINLVSYHFHLCFISLVQSNPLLQTTPLTVKEREILKWLSTGMIKQEIADKTLVSIHTVDFHSRNILKKMDAKNMTAALVTAIKEGLLIL